MNRCDLPVKLPSILKREEELAPSSPQVVYGYFDQLQKQLEKLQILHRPECIWNVGETKLVFDVHEMGAGAAHSQKVNIKDTSNREAITVMAGISAAGRKLPPLIIFKGKNSIKVL